MAVSIEGGESACSNFMSGGVVIRKCNRGLGEQDKLRTKSSEPLTASDDVPFSVIEKLIQHQHFTPPPPLQKYYMSSRYMRDLPRDNPLVSTEVLRPSDAMHNPSQPFEFLLKETCLMFSSSLRSLKSKRTFESRAKRSSVNLVRTHFQLTCAFYKNQTVSLERNDGTFKDGDENPVPAESSS
ncbi:hypothetical protein Tco_0795871 [Tanacetum coccineum]